MVQRTRAGIEGAVREFNIAIAIDPDYALAHAELAIATLFSNRYSYGDLTDSEAIARATPHAERAMALDPTLAEAHAATGWLLGMSVQFKFRRSPDTLQAGHPDQPQLCDRL